MLFPLPQLIAPSVTLESYTQPILGNAPSCFINPWCHQQEWRRRRRRWRGRHSKRMDSQAREMKPGYVTHAAYHGHIYSWWNLSHWTTAGILTICCSSGNSVLLGDFTLMLHFHSTSQKEQPFPSAPAVPVFPSLLGAGTVLTGPRNSKEQSMTPVSVVLNWSFHTVWGGLCSTDRLCVYSILVSFRWFSVVMNGTDQTWDALSQEQDKHRMRDRDVIHTRGEQVCHLSCYRLQVLPKAPTTPASFWSRTTTLCVTRHPRAAQLFPRR